MSAYEVKLNRYTEVYPNEFFELTAVKSKIVDRVNYAVEDVWEKGFTHFLEGRDLRETESYYSEKENFFTRRFGVNTERPHEAFWIDDKRSRWVYSYPLIFWLDGMLKAFFKSKEKLDFTLDTDDYFVFRKVCYLRVVDELVERIRMKLEIDKSKSDLSKYAEYKVFIEDCSGFFKEKYPERSMGGDFFSYFDSIMLSPYEKHKERVNGRCEIVVQAILKQAKAVSDAPLGKLKVD